MVNINRFKANSIKINEGDWVKLTGEYEGMEIKTRGFTDTYTDARVARMRRAAMRYAGDTNRIPNAEARKILTDTLCEYCLLDVRGVEDQNGNPIPFDTFKELLYDPNFNDLFQAISNAAAAITVEREADIVDTKKN